MADHTQRTNDTGDGFTVDLDERACPTCHRDLQPWEDECPDCREPAVLRYSLAPAMPAPPAHLVDEDPRTGDPAATAEDGTELISRALAVTQEETREPTDDDLPQPPPVGGDPHFD